MHIVENKRDRRFFYLMAFQETQSDEQLSTGDRGDSIGMIASIDNTHVA